jgi:hypothetical protein
MVDRKTLSQEERIELLEREVSVLRKVLREIYGFL